jgi:hypothetical protein
MRLRDFILALGVRGQVALIVFLAASIQAQPVDVPPSAAQLREWIDEGSVSSGKHSSLL